jgi:DNA-binding MarR family transcriptional regulator
MKTDNVSKLLGACHEAKQIVDLMPRLPKGMKPSHIHVIDIICQLQQANGLVRISDIGTALHVTNPNITRLVNGLVELKAVKKVQSKEDKRVFTVSPTALGLEYYRKYLKEYHYEVAKQLAGISEEDLETTARVIHEAYCIMSDKNRKRGKSF